MLTFNSTSDQPVNRDCLGIQTAVSPCAMLGSGATLSFSSGIICALQKTECLSEGALARLLQELGADRMIILK